MAKKKPEPTRNLDFSVQGFSGLKQYGGIIDEEFLRRLRGTYGIKTYREMSDNSSTVGAIFFLIKALCRQVEWRVEPAGTEQAALDQAEFVESCLIDMSLTWEDFISEVLSFLNYGWSYFETIYKVRRGDTANPSTRSQFDDGKIGWRKLAFRAQDTLYRWEFDEEDDGLRGMHQMSPFKNHTAYVPIEKALLFRTEVTKGNPEGRSILRNAVIDYHYLKRISNIEAIGIERDMTGLLTMEVPIEMLATDAKPEHKSVRTQLEKMLSELKRDEREYAMVPAELDRENNPTGYKLKLLSTGGRRPIDTNATKMYYKTNILQSVLAQFLQLGVSGVGSFALASSQTNLFSTALGSVLQIITSTTNRFGISRLMKLNGVPQELWPELVHGDIETPPLAEIGAYIQAMASAGQMPDDEAIQRKLLEYAKLPLPEKEGHGEGEPALEPEKKQGVKKSFFRRGRTHRTNNAPMRGLSFLTGQK